MICSSRDDRFTMSPRANWTNNGISAASVFLAVIDVATPLSRRHKQAMDNCKREAWLSRNLVTFAILF